MKRNRWWLTLHHSRISEQYVIQICQDPGIKSSHQRLLLFSSVDYALLISGISSSHLRNLHFHWSMFTIKQISLPGGRGAKYHISKLVGDHSCLSGTHGTHANDIVQGLGLSSASVSLENLIQSYTGWFEMKL